MVEGLILWQVGWFDPKAKKGKIRGGDASIAATLGPVQIRGVSDPGASFANREPGNVAEPYAGCNIRDQQGSHEWYRVSKVVEHKNTASGIGLGYFEQ
jgi:hypothetical protein